MTIYTIEEMNYYDLDLSERVKEYLLQIDPATFKCRKFLELRQDGEEVDEVEQVLVNTMKHLKKTTNPFISTNYYIDWDGRQIEPWEWYFKNEYLNKHVGDDIVGSHRVSTVWLGIRHQSELIFETLVFPIENEEVKLIEDFGARYPNLHDAVAGHHYICYMVREGKIQELIDS